MLLNEKNRASVSGAYEPVSSDSEDTTSLPPAYVPRGDSGPSSGAMVVVPQRPSLVPAGPPINGLVMTAKNDRIQGSWLLDPLAAQLPTQNLVQMFLDGRAEKTKRRSKGTGPPTAAFTSRHGSISSVLRILGDSTGRATATIRAESRGGNIVLDLVSITPMRTAHVDGRSRRGNVTLLVPRTFCGIIELKSRKGTVEVLPALAAVARVVHKKNNETTLLLGNGPVPQVGAENTTDTARLYSRHGRVRIGFSGEDTFTEPLNLMEQAAQLIQKFIIPSEKS
ncbi:hypothetical protein BC834DRAFT_966397 [Gloeopeniophorella convolvens]|nr:hypothetical protein BC834DRAFT_966397 [Gloeopeniophorella convolvens]